MKMKTFLARGGRASLTPPLDPPLRQGRLGWVPQNRTCDLYTPEVYLVGVGAGF